MEEESQADVGALLRGEDEAAVGEWIGAILDQGGEQPKRKRGRPAGKAGRPKQAVPELKASPPSRKRRASKALSGLEVEDASDEAASEEEEEEEEETEEEEEEEEEEWAGKRRPKKKQSKAAARKARAKAQRKQKRGRRASSGDAEEGEEASPRLRELSISEQLARAGLGLVVGGGGGMGPTWFYVPVRMHPWGSSCTGGGGPVCCDIEETEVAVCVR